MKEAAHSVGDQSNIEKQTACCTTDIRFIKLVPTIYWGTENMLASHVLLKKSPQSRPAIQELDATAFCDSSVNKGNEDENKLRSTLK